MQELRCLFALMVGSTRRFVDPSAAVELLRDAFRTSEAQQVRQTLPADRKIPPYGFALIITAEHLPARCNSDDKAHFNHR